MMKMFVTSSHESEDRLRHGLRPRCQPGMQVGGR